MVESPLIQRLAIIGVGLIGGSLSLALKQAGAVGEVIGCGRGKPNLEKALELGIIDRYSREPNEAVKDADLIFLATPVKALGSVTAELLPNVKPGAVITDGGSVKGEVVKMIEPLLPEGIHFVPGHPIAGTEKSGAEAAFTTLYQGKRCILTPTSKTDPQALALVEQMWRIAGSDVVTMSLEKHDKILAAISHLPHMVAYSLVNAVGSYDHYEENILEYSAGGFRDFTRIASSDPVMWRDIAETNREALLEMMAQFETFFGELKADIAEGSGDKLFEFFLRSKQLRDAIL
ncbi:MAG: prephenate dehydrogenase/arogenate dehydrogenase family protein [Desulfuromonadales bacterium]|nr:prephenate dehydrogenase/arogenate dehydrogenase family protein [Desulfuromonadales bacterium]MBN2791264.1 prephenate dehydrogenase/arogenate dehydrogenase family protein [Desulfuromonadales bacterium]